MARKIQPVREEIKIKLIKHPNGGYELDSGPDIDTTGLNRAKFNRKEICCSVYYDPEIFLYHHARQAALLMLGQAARGSE